MKLYKGAELKMGIVAETRIVNNRATYYFISYSVIKDISEGRNKKAIDVLTGQELPYRDLEKATKTLIWPTEPYFYTPASVDLNLNPHLFYSEKAIEKHVRNYAEKKGLYFSFIEEEKKSIEDNKVKQKIVKTK